jgi:oligopeptide/dipeptide ABC transporter ATP-binding protein
MSETTHSDRTRAGTDDVVLELRNVEVTYEMSRGRARVLDDISLDVMRGETFGIVGESGCGKSMFGSTLLDAVRDPGLLTGEIRYYPDEGDPIDLLELSGSELNHVRWEDISIMYQGAMNAYNPTQNIRTHFKETFTAHNVDREAEMEHARELIERVNLDPERILDAHQHELSGGEKQRVLLALSLVLEPEILILDEPTAALDLLTQRSILNLLQELKEEYNLTLLIISHDIPVVSGMADRLAVMYAFDFVELGTAREVLLEPEHPYTRSLLRSTLGLSQPIEEVDTIPGETPDPINVPSGCPFHPRCPISDDRCEIEEPELRAPEDGDHRVACFYPDRAVSEMSVPVLEDEER